MRLALIGFSNVGQAFARLLEWKQAVYPFRITAVHTAHHGTAYSEKGIYTEPPFGPAASSVDEFLDRARPEIVIELTTLDPIRGEPATSHIRKALQRGAHVVTANKGPIAHAYSALCREARLAGVEFRFESTCMDGAPVYNMVRNDLPGVRILGFEGVLNSTSKIVIAAMRRGLTMEDGIEEARALGIAEADVAYDIDGWDSAAKTAALANVLMDAGLSPNDVDRRGIAQLTPAKLRKMAESRKTVCLVSRARQTPSGVRMRVRAEVLDETDLLAAVQGTSTLLLLHTDLMGTVGTVSISPGVDQTAYGVFSDVVDIAKNA